MSGKFLIFLLLNVVTCKFMEMENKHFSTKEDELTLLPNEFPKLAKVFETLKKDKPESYEKIIKAESIIGYLPLKEQMDIFNKTKSGIKLESEEIKTILGESLLKSKINNIKDYLRRNSYRLFTGLGCLKEVSQKFYSDSREDRKLLDTIYKTIDNIVASQVIYDEAENTFVDKVSELLSSSKITEDNGNYVVDQAQAQNQAQAQALEQHFIDFSKAKQKHNRIVHQNVMIAQQMISQMKGCFNEENTNEDAGMNTEAYKAPEINYKGKTIVGINNGERIHSKTQNNFALNKGFSLGKSSIDLTSSKSDPTFSLLSEGVAFINGALSSCPNDVTAKLSQLLGGYSSIRPFANIDSIYGKDCMDVACQFTFNGIQIQHIFYCETQTETNESIFDFGGLSSKDENGELNVVYSYGKIYGEKTQGCFSVFMSGGKNDKESCRDTMTQKCGNELDYRCKQSGLYDYLNENPISTPLQNPDIKILYDNFTLGNFILKPSALASYSLIEQMIQKGGVDKYKYSGPATFETAEEPTAQPTDQTNEQMAVYRKIIDRSYSQLVNNSFHISPTYIILLFISSFLLL